MCAFSSLTGADGALLHERCVLSLLTAADTPAATSFKDSIKGGEGRAALDQRLLAHKKHSSLQEEAEASFKVVRLPVVRLPATRNSEGEWRAQVVSQTELHKPQPFAKGRGAPASMVAAVAHVCTRAWIQRPSRRTSSGRSPRRAQPTRTLQEEHALTVLYGCAVRYRAVTWYSEVTSMWVYVLYSALVLYTVHYPPALSTCKWIINRGG